MIYFSYIIYINLRTLKIMKKRKRRKKKRVKQKELCDMNVCETMEWEARHALNSFQQRLSLAVVDKPKFTNPGLVIGVKIVKRLEQL
jgi:hypothetical protein